MKAEDWTEEGEECVFVCVCEGTEQRRMDLNGDNFSIAVQVAPAVEEFERSEEEMSDTLYLHVQRPLRLNQYWSGLLSHFIHQVLDMMLPTCEAADS